MLHNYYLVTISLPPSSAWLEDSQLIQRCTSTYTNARRVSLHARPLRSLGGRSCGRLLDSRDASAWQASLSREVQVKPY